MVGCTLHRFDFILIFSNKVQQHIVRSVELEILIYDM